MSTFRNDLSSPPPLPPPARQESIMASATRGYQALRQRWMCMGPRCAERDGLRSWCKLPARIQLQDGWCCGPECFQAAFEQLAAALLRSTPGWQQTRAPHRHRIPLGLLLLSRGEIDNAQLRRALEAQQARGEGRIGDWLVRQRAMTEEGVAAAVGLQWARPTFRLAQSQGWRLCSRWVPLPMLEALRMLPLHFAAQRRRLYVGFTQAIDFNALAALGLIFECKLESCIVTDSALNSVFEQMRAQPGDDRVEEVAFERMDEVGEIAGIVRQYAQHVEARQIRLAMMGPFLWVRIRGERIVHVTFRGRG